MSDSLTTEPESSFVCDCREFARSACVGEPFYAEHEGKRFCVFHHIGQEKSVDFNIALHRKLGNNDFDFRGVWFPDERSFIDVDFTTPADFSYAVFSPRVSFSGVTFGSWVHFNHARFCEDADFSEAICTGVAFFRGVTFHAKADFYGVDFKARANFGFSTFGAKADFSGSSFSGLTSFMHVTFGEIANFADSTFSEKGSFGNATFCGNVSFSDATFNTEANFTDAGFNGYVEFAGNEMRAQFGSNFALDLQFARVENPDHVSFHTAILRPHWFVNVDSRKFHFTNVDWDWRSISEEILSLRIKLTSSPYRLLAIACRQLAVNAEENHRYEEASRFRYMAMDAGRRVRWRGFAFWSLSWWYWLASGYGERVSQAVLVFLGILLLSALFYNHVGFVRWEPKLASENDMASARRDDVGAPLRFGRALTCSVGVMTFQRPEPRPATTTAHAVVLLETILGPVQAALLALAIRRKFMR